MKTSHCILLKPMVKYDYYGKQEEILQMEYELCQYNDNIFYYYINYVINVLVHL